MTSNKNTIHKPFCYEHENSDTIIIFTHGILEGPNQFINLAKLAFNKGFSVSALLLPGHGGSGKYFANSNLEKWECCLDEHIRSISIKYKKIILVGHSMGSLLSISSFIKSSEKIKGIVLLATPLSIHLRFGGIVRSLKVAFGISKEDDILTSAAFNSCSINRSSLFTYLSWIPRYLDLFNLIINTKKNLKYINIPLLIVHTSKDEFVNNRSIKIFKQKLINDNYKLLILENSRHFYYDESDIEKLNKEFELFLSNYKFYKCNS